MHFDPRVQRALREVGLDDADLRRASDLVAEAVSRDADRLESFFEAHDTLHADLDRAHSDAEIEAVAVESLDLYTHADDLRGYLRFESWGAYVEGGRPLSERVVELTLGPTVHDRVRFATDPDAL
ncbi:MAG: hypothetical protein ABEH40_09170 [Haloferacaceae archaeon]